ncbi:hypothetical protein SORBI_3004G010600 [Sorghum bicolor]|nr:hypothetical protein SORBI_3004G010600 [Sorghum bicolor]
MSSAPTGGKPSLPPRPISVSTARGPSSASGKPLPPRPTSREEVVASGTAEKGKGKTSKDKDQKAEAEKVPRKLKGQVKSWLEKVQNKQIWRKVLHRIRNNRNHTIMNPHVNYQKVHMAGIIRHYSLLERVAEQGFHSNVLELCRAYSEFRPVLGDGECFYRSFIFSYLEQVLDRQDTHEEHRILAAVKGVARQHARLGWASEFSSSHKAFKKLIKKVMRWKTHSRWKHVPTINSYRTEKLLEFFSSYDKTNDIFTFLRLVAAIWICSHSEEFEPLIPELNEGYTLTDWCSREVIQRKVFTDHIQIIALVRALGVPLRVEYLFQEVGQDLYTGQTSEDDISICICLPCHHHVLPPAHQVPRVTVLYSDQHYDVIYPYCADGKVILTDVRSSQQSDKIECPTAAKSPSQHQGSSYSDEKSSQRLTG